MIKAQTPEEAKTDEEVDCGHAYAAHWRARAEAAERLVTDTQAELEAEKLRKAAAVDSVNGCAVRVKELAGQLLALREGIAAMEKEMLAAASVQQAASREANHAGNIELDAYRDGKSMALKDCADCLSSLLQGSKA